MSKPSPDRRGLTPRQRAFVALSARAALPEAAPLDPFFARARATGASARALAEIGLMLHLHAGFPAAIEFLRALRAWERASARGSRSPSPAARRAGAGVEPTASGWRARGEALCRRIYGADYGRLRAFMKQLHPDLDAWMIVDGYGKTLSRPGLGVRERELATVAVLAALGWERQLGAHRAGAARVGLAPRAVTQAVAAGMRAAARNRA